MATYVVHNGDRFSCSGIGAVATIVLISQVVVVAVVSRSRIRVDQLSCNDDLCVDRATVVADDINLGFQSASFAASKQM